MTARNIVRIGRFVSVLALAAMPALVGCEEYVKPPIQARQDPFQPGQINMTSDDLRAHTAVDKPDVSRDDGGLLHVTVPIRATTNKQLYIDYRVTFFDRDGAPLNQTGWFTKTLSPNVHDHFSVNSTSPLAADFQIDVRYAK